MSDRIRMYTTTWCVDCRRAKWFLSERQVAFEEIDIERNCRAAEFVKHANHGKYRVPTFEVNGRTFHCSPYDPERLSRELGLEGKTSGPLREAVVASFSASGR